MTVDLQHGTIGFEGALGMFQAVSTTDAIPLARPSQNDPAEIMRLLDAGVYGIICPMVSTAADAARLVRACRNPPVGSRSFGPARGTLYGSADHFAHANDEVLAMAMIETAEALANLDAILDTPGNDAMLLRGAMTAAVSAARGA